MMQQNRVDGGEDRGRGADAERQREDGYGRESGTLTKRAYGIAKITPKSIEPEERPAIATLFLHLLDPAEAAPSRMARFLGTHPVLDVVLGLHCKMQAKFFVEFLFQAPLLKKGMNPGSESSVPDHELSS